MIKEDQSFERGRVTLQMGEQWQRLLLYCCLFYSVHTNITRCTYTRMDISVFSISVFVSFYSLLARYSIAMILLAFWPLCICICLRLAHWLVQWFDGWQKGQRPASKLKREKWKKKINNERTNEFCVCRRERDKHLLLFSYTNLIYSFFVTYIFIFILQNYKKKKYHFICSSRVRFNIFSASGYWRDQSE